MASNLSSNAPNYDLLIKLLLIGDSGVGKSSLLMRFCDETFTDSFITTIGIDFKVKTILLDGKRIKLQIWDTAGQERFRTITNAYYRGCAGVLLVYDVTDVNSFANVDTWAKAIDMNAGLGVHKVLIANKCDLRDGTDVTTKQGQTLADELGIRFFETSAKSNTNVTECFHSLAAEIFAQRSATNELLPTRGLPMDPRSGHKNRCCS